MTASLLEYAPISGHNPEYFFGEHFNYPLWVEFKSNNDTIWYGCFPKAYANGYTNVLIDNNTATAFIVAGGVGFLINLTEKKVLLKIEESFTIESALKTNNPEYYIASIYYGAYIITTMGDVKIIEPHFTTDGIFFVKQNGNKVMGLLDAPMNDYESKYDFELDLHTFQFSIYEPEKRSFWQTLFGL